MDTAGLLQDAYGRIHEIVHHAASDLDAEALAYRPDPDGNSIAWLVWHLTRVQDDHVADVAGTEQIWTKEGFYDRFGLPFAPSDTGYGHRNNEVAAVRVDSPGLLLGYHDAVYEHTRSYLAGLKDPDLDRIVDERWNPPVSLGVRLVSVISDNLQHAGQAAFVRGMNQRL
ncbi:MAG: DinB family protein [Acidimicrobiaceae bacterium]|nr:DinB family protein [Acidimicrobiaceae bacterium]